MKLRKYIALLFASVLASCATSAPSTTTQTSGNAKPYPLTTCIVTGNRLGSMGTPVTIVHGSQEVKFCCKPCVKKFNANPEKYLSKIQ